jgi:hypothetical protein
MNLILSAVNAPAEAVLLWATRVTLVLMGAVFITRITVSFEWRQRIWRFLHKHHMM